MLHFCIWVPISMLEALCLQHKSSCVVTVCLLILLKELASSKSEPPGKSQKEILRKVYGKVCPGYVVSDFLQGDVPGSIQTMNEKDAGHSGEGLHSDFPPQG